MPEEIPTSPPPGGEGEPSTERRVVMMPGRDEMVEKLREAKIYGITSRSDRIFDRFIDQVAGTEKVGRGLQLVWELAMYDELGNYPPVVQAAMDQYFERMIDAVTPDPEVAEEAKQAKRQVLDELRRPRE